jgi:hypothetical protein
MSKVSRDTASEVADYGPAEDRTDHFDGYTINFTSIREDSDLARSSKDCRVTAASAPIGATCWPAA